ncbi:hypothetical protein GJ496_006010 [Pomphorhynchus laevis]|nr:hypothetical protein GJ496_006010 [Pomphorhynchus laevis]
MFQLKQSTFKDFTAIANVLTTQINLDNIPLLLRQAQHNSDKILEHLKFVISHVVMAYCNLFDTWPKSSNQLIYQVNDHNDQNDNDNDIDRALSPLKTRNRCDLTHQQTIFALSNCKSNAIVYDEFLNPKLDNLKNIRPVLNAPFDKTLKVAKEEMHYESFNTDIIDSLKAQMEEYISALNKEIQKMKIICQEDLSKESIAEIQIEIVEFHKFYDYCKPKIIMLLTKSESVEYDKSCEGKISWERFNNVKSLSNILKTKLACYKNYLYDLDRKLETIESLQNMVDVTNQQADIDNVLATADTQTQFFNKDKINVHSLTTNLPIKTEFNTSTTSYIENTTDFLSNLNELHDKQKNVESQVLLTLDVESLIRQYSIATG